MRLSATIPLLLLPALLLACGDKDDDSGGGDVGCTTEARVRVMVTVEGEGGRLPEDLAVTWSTPDSDLNPCEPWPGSPEYACGFEQAGPITVTASGRYYRTASQTVTVQADACHVQTESLTLVLEPVDCTAVEIPAVTLSVLAADGSLVPEAVGYFAPSDEDWDSPGVCEDGLDGFMSCASELVGDLDVWVQAPGFQTWTEQIQVLHDGCHPITEHRDVVLVPG